MPDWPAAFCSRFPIEASDAFRKPVADRIGGFEPEQCTSRLVQVSDASIGIGHNDAFLNGVENRFQKAFLLRQAQKIILHLFRSDPPKPLDKFFNEARFHVLEAPNSNVQHSVNHQAPTFEGSSLLGACASALGTSTVSISTLK